MKKNVTLWTLALVCFVSLMSFTTIDPAKSPLVWKTELIDSGEIPQGTPKTFEFEFTNTSDKAVKIADAHASCGCTVADYPKDEVKPGQTAKIKATYNAANKGAFTKTVTVKISENDTPIILTLKGTVI